jgi:hypothetical protein
VTSYSRASLILPWINGCQTTPNRRGQAWQYALTKLFSPLDGLRRKEFGGMLLEVAHFGDKDTIALGADQRIYATVLHLDRRFEALT